MKWQTMFKGDYLTAAEFGGRQPTFTISAVVPCVMKEEGDKEKQKASIKLVETARPWVLGKTVAMCLAAMWGDEIKNWIGKRVTVYADPNVKFGKDIVGGIRVLGSPDLPAAKSVLIKLPRKKPFTVTLQKTVPKQADQAPPAVPATQPVSAPLPPATEPGVPAETFETPGAPTREEVAAAEAEALHAAGGTF